MSNRIAAIYEQGILRPLMPLNLREHQQVQVQIIANAPQETAEQMLARLMFVGRVSPLDCPEDMEPLSETERAALTKILNESLSAPFWHTGPDELH
jgi:predicted DNA-binding antitoxin AbrB/MazE fold protein